MVPARLTQTQKFVMAKFIYEHASIYSDYVLNFDDEVELFGRTYYIRLNNEWVLNGVRQYDGIWEVDINAGEDIPINPEDEKEVFNIANAMRTFSLKERSDIEEMERRGIVDYAFT